MLTYGINYCLDSDDSHIYGSGLDLSPELPIRALSCFLTTFSGISQGRLQLQVASHPPPSSCLPPSWCEKPKQPRWRRRNPFDANKLSPGTEVVAWPAFQRTYPRRGLQPRTNTFIPPRPSQSRFLPSFGSH